MEVLVVIIIIGILAALAYSSFADIIFTSRAKETAQTMRSFAERALAESKRQNETALLELEESNIIKYTIGTSPAVSASLSGGFSVNFVKGAPNCVEAIGSLESFNDGVESVPAIGISSLNPEEGYFAVCDAKGYCGAAIKVQNKNSFIACIKKPNSSSWEVL